MIFVKLSLGMFFLRIVLQRWQQWLVKGVMAMSVVFGIAYTFFVIFQCGAPIQGKFQNPTLYIYSWLDKTLKEQCLTWL